ncbi:MAG: amidohydrolase [Gammaproteobacteria bacterium]|nr:amidohydrolase [Gammaproteobacteria bacterium]
MLTVYTAKSVITMNPSMPRATAVAVRDGRIIEVGTLESMQPWLAAHQHQIDERFADAIITPGFIDPHLHPTMAAVLLPTHFITAMEWKLPWGTVSPVTTAQGFADRAAQLHAELEPGEPLFIWGYHQLWHGPMSRPLLNEISAARPVVVWHRSFHELYMNDGMLEMLDITESEAGNRKQIDYPNGHFFENGLGYAINKLNPYILSPERYAEGLERLKQVVHHGGHTTIADMAVGLFNFDMEWRASTQVLEAPDTPFRVEMVSHAMRLLADHASHTKACEFVRSLPERNTHRLHFSDHVKLFADGAFFSQLAQLGEPGYIDGHHGEWLMTPEQLEEAMRVYWNAGMKIHLHVTGDLGVELGLDVLEKLQWERPRFNHGFTFEHFGLSTPEQVERIAALGANVSANVYYLHELSDIYAREGIGYERASQMARLGTCFRHGIRTTVHSDFTMAPAEPLNSAWVAVNRLNCEGMVMGPQECLTAEQALAAITINAAHIIGRADDVGSIRAGKLADFTVLAEDPLAVAPERLKDIVILATVFEGRPFPIEGSSA